MVSILEAKKTIEEVLLQREEVIGVGLSHDNQRIRIYVIEDQETVPDLPKTMAGFPVEIVPIPGFVTSGGENYRTMRFRPVPGGVSASHTGVTAGTVGAVIRDKVSGNKMFLSNNHVFANTTSTNNYRGHVGDPIIQPSPSDRGTPSDTIATLYKFIPFVDDKTNLVDAALAMPVDQSIASSYILANDNFDMVSINGVKSITAPIRVKKYGRTSGEDWGEILDFNFAVAVDFDDGKTRNFVDQILVSIETRGGDSGSILLDGDNNAVGLVFAGGIDKKGRWYGVANKIRNVLAMLSDDEVDVSDGWSSSHAMVEAPPQFEAETTSDTEPITPDHTLRNLLMVGAGLTAAVLAWEGLNTDKA